MSNPKRIISTNSLTNAKISAQPTSTSGQPTQQPEIKMATKGNIKVKSAKKKSNIQNPLLNSLMKVKKAPVRNVTNETNESPISPVATFIPEKETQVIKSGSSGIILQPSTSNYAQPDPEFAEKMDAEIEKDEFFSFILKAPAARKKINFDKTPAEDIVKHLQIQQRLSYTPSSSRMIKKSVSSIVEKTPSVESVDSNKEDIDEFLPGSHALASKPRAKSFVRKIEIPWRAKSEFSSRAEQRKKIFQHFKMSPDPPQSPPQPKSKPSKSYTATGVATVKPYTVHYLTQTTLPKGFKSKTLPRKPAEQSIALKAKQTKKFQEQNQSMVVAEGSKNVLAPHTGLLAVGKSKQLKAKRIASKMSKYDGDGQLSEQNDSDSIIQTLLDKIEPLPSDSDYADD